MIIGISGKQGAGKDYVADAIIRNMMPDAKKVSFADKLKKTAAFMLDEDESKLYTQEGKQAHNWTGMSNRQFLQEFGSKVREIYPMFWVEAAMRQGDGDVIIPDVRYKNEMVAIKEAGGYVVRVEMMAAPSYWFGVTGISKSALWDRMMTKDRFLCMASLWSSDVSDEAIIDSLSHVSETDLDNEEFDLTITNIYGKEPDISGIGCFK